jgi:hypothetical protein
MIVVLKIYEMENYTIVLTRDKSATNYQLN